jgi:hypothetical protein
MGDIYFTQVGVYASKIYPIYTNILSNPVGKLIIDEIKATSRDLTFKPRKKTDVDQYGVCDASTLVRRRASEWGRRQGAGALVHGPA